MKARPLEIMVLAALAMIVVAVLGVSLRMWNLRSETLGNVDRELTAMATVLAEQVERSSQIIESVLDEMADKAEDHVDRQSDEYRSFISSRQVYDDLHYKLRRMPQVDVLTYTDEKGDVLNITRGWPTPAVNLADRDYFQFLAANDPKRPFISAPVQNKVTGAWTVYFAKRISDASGAFRGVVLAGFRPEYFLRGLDAVSMFPKRSLLLARDDGTILLRHPDPVPRTGDRVPTDSPWYGVKRDGGLLRMPGMYLTETLRIAVQPVATYPFVLNVSEPEGPILARWRWRAAAFAIFTVFMSIVLATAIIGLYRQYLRLNASKQVLDEKNQVIATANSRFNAALGSLSQGLALFNAQGHMLIHNDQFLHIMRLNPSMIAPTTSCEELIAICTRGVRNRTGSSGTLIGTPGWNKNKRATENWDFAFGRSCRVVIDPVASGGWVMTCEDTTEARMANARIEWLAHHDPLTSLANRAHFLESLGRITAEKRDRLYALALIDVDHFKEINDTHGHGVGDQLLANLAHRLTENLSADSIIARLGGDEFAVLVPGDDQRPDRLVDDIHHLQRTVSGRFRLTDIEIASEVSVGVVLLSPDDHDGEALLRHADLALYRAKAEGRGTCCQFQPDMEADYNARQSLTADLRHAIERGELFVHYQPIVDADNMRIVAMEALLRWEHPSKGMISPTEFIPLAEESGLITELGGWVLATACREATQWPADIRLCINVSSVQLSQNDFPGVVASAISETGIAAHRLQLEITETVLLRDTPRVKESLAAIRAMGMTVVLDDFGTGYSSLSYLRRFAFDGIKIDKSFISGGPRSDAWALVSATIMLAHSLGLSVTAEGVETHELASRLRLDGVNFLQGFLLGHPAPQADWLPRLQDPPQIAAAG